MAAFISNFILMFSALCGTTGAEASAVLRRPSNVRLTSYNMDLVLRWSPPEEGGTPRDLVYTAELVSQVPINPYRVGCTNTSALECDFTQHFRGSMSEYGKYSGRVRAAFGSERSEWAESAKFTMDKDTIIGPPSITLFSNGATIEVSIRDPVFTISTLRDVYDFAAYNISYWKDGQMEKAQSISNIQQNWLNLGDLDVWTTYCVQVQIVILGSKPSQPSSTVCDSTTNGEGTPWVAAVAAFVVMAAVMALVVVVVVYRKAISHFLCPKDALPQHLKQFFLSQTDPCMYVAMKNSQPPEEVYHQVSVLPNDWTAEEGRPLEAAAPERNYPPNCSVGGEGALASKLEK